MATVPGSAGLLADLEGRGLVQDCTDRAELSARLAAGPMTLYCGFDPTADSLHVGHLLGVVTLRRFQRAGHRPIAVVGGATGMVGDPSGRSDERSLLDPDVVAANVAAIRRQLESLLASGPGERATAVVLDNAMWTGRQSLLGFLRDVGKHVTVGQMMAKEPVRARMAGATGISFTEFAYMLLQANDYLWLHTHEGCELQVGGSDQWGNITAGIDLVRRRAGHHVHGLTWPLLTRADGTKLGKSAGENVWLSAHRTRPYTFFQHWMQVGDADVGPMLAQLGFLDAGEVARVTAAHAAAPERREGQRRLARELTTLVHGPELSAAADDASRVLFGTELDEVPESALAAVAAEVATTTIPAGRFTDGIDLVDLLVETGLAVSRGEARRVLAQGAVYLNNRPVGPEAASVSPRQLRFGRYLLLRRGKRTYHLVQSR